MNVTLPDISASNIKQTCQQCSDAVSDKTESSGHSKKFHEFMAETVKSKVEPAGNTSAPADETCKDLKENEAEADSDADFNLSHERLKMQKLIKLIRAGLQKWTDTDKSDDVDQEAISNAAVLINDLIKLVSNAEQEKTSTENVSNINTVEKDAGLILKLIHSGMLKQMSSGTAAGKADTTDKNQVIQSQKTKSKDALSEIFEIIKNEPLEETIHNKPAEAFTDVSDKKMKNTRLNFRNIVFSSDEEYEKTGKTDEKASEKIKAEIKSVSENPKNTSAGSNTAKEEKLLKNMLQGSEEKSDNNDNKIDRINNFITHINNALKPESDAVNGSGQLLVNRDSMAKDVVKVLNVMSTGNLKQLTVKVAPKELGEMVIKLTLEAGSLKANIAAHNKETYDLLSASISDITKSLNNSDLKIQSVNVNIYNDDTAFFSSSGQGSQNFQENSQSGRRWSGGFETGKISEERLQEDIVIQNSNISILA